MLIAIMGAAAVTGLSGPGKAGAASTYIARPDLHIATEAKHYAAYGYCGRDGGCPAEISTNTLFDVYLKPWYYYAQAGGRAVMAAHNEVNGMPCHANKELNQALRDAFGFGQGLCASDAGDVSSVARYRVAPDQVHAGALAMNAGMDQDLEYPGAFRPENIQQMLQMGLITNATLDRAVGNVLRQKFASGLFDNNASLLYVDPAKQAATMDTPEHRSLARTVAEEGITLLKNDGVLPLKGMGKSIRTVAVVGPNADNTHSHIGLYCDSNPSRGIVTLLNASIAAANASDNAFEVVYERGSCLGGTPGCPCWGGCHSSVPHQLQCGNVTGLPGWDTQKVGDYRMPCDTADTSLVASAAAIAAKADVTLLVIGDQSTTSTDPGFKPYVREVATVGEHFDRDNLDPVGAQLDLLRAVVAAAPAGKGGGVLVHGRTVTFGAGPGDGYNELFEKAGAVLATWHPGEEGGVAIWNILSGAVNPSGRTAHTWPRTVGQVHQYVPHFLEQRTRSINSPYADYAPATPLVPFGFGLSYSTFVFANMQLLNAHGDRCDERARGCSVDKSEPSASFTVSLDVTNQGPMDGKVVVQVYFSQTLASRVRFARMLLDFDKVHVAVGQTQSVKVVVPITGLEMWSSADNSYIVESSVYEISVGQYVTDGKMITHRLTVK